MSTLLVMGWKHSQGEFNGNNYDYTTIYTRARLRAADNQRGYAGIEIRGEPFLVEKLSKLDFSKGDVECDVVTEQVAIGKGMFQDLAVDIRPLPASATNQRTGNSASASPST